jgi:DNA-binding Lrp family transcriptional regulator
VQAESDWHLILFVGITMLTDMEIDATDRAILYVLQQQDPTELTVSEIADRVDVSASTVSNRIQQMRAGDVLQGSIPDIDYERAGMPHHFVCVCTVPIERRDSVTQDILQLTPAISTRELLTGTRNLHIEAACPSNADVEQFIEQVSEFDLTIEQIQIVSDQYHQPLDFFEEHAGTDSDG